MSERTFACSPDCDSADIFIIKPCNCHNSELTTLRERVRELEAMNGGYRQTTDMLRDQNVMHEVRIRELEEAMRRMIGEHEPGSDCVATGPLTGTAMDYVCVFCEGKKILKK